MNRTIGRILKIMGVVLATLAGFAFLYFGAGYCLSRIAVNKNPSVGEDVKIYVLTNGAHTDIVVPVRNEVIDWTGTVKFEHTVGNDPTASWVAFGWGDKGFYLDTPTWADLSMRVAFNAAFGTSTSAMHVTFYKRLAENDNCKSMTISQQDYRRLVQYIRMSFLHDSHGEVVPIVTDANYGDDDAFYEAVGRYNLFFTCNTWANYALKACGQKASVWTAFDTGIFHHYRAK